MDLTPVNITLKNKTLEVQAGITLSKALRLLKLSPHAYLAARAGELITEDEMLGAGDQIQLIAVISGG